MIRIQFIKSNQSRDTISNSTRNPKGTTVKSIYAIASPSDTHMVRAISAHFLMRIIFARNRRDFLDLVFCVVVVVQKMGTTPRWSGYSFLPKRVVNPPWYAFYSRHQAEDDDDVDDDDNDGGPGDRWNVIACESGFYRAVIFVHIWMEGRRSVRGVGRYVYVTCVCACVCVFGCGSRNDMFVGIGHAICAVCVRIWAQGMGHGTVCVREGAKEFVECLRKGMRAVGLAVCNAIYVTTTFFSRVQLILRLSPFDG